MNASARPAVAFSLAVANDASHNHADDTDGEAIETSFFFNLPLSIEQDTARVGGTVISTISAATTPVACHKACASSTACASWVVDATKQHCTLLSTVPDSQFATGSFSGVKGTWQADGDECVVLTRPGASPASGDLSLCAKVTGGGDNGDGKATGKVTLGSGDSLHSLFAAFEATGTLPGLPASQNSSSSTATATANNDAYAAAAVSASVPPGGRATMTIVLSWYVE